MTTELLVLERYLKEVLDVQVTTKPWPDGGRLPAVLRNLYSFFELQIMDVPCLIMRDRAREELSPATVRKHMALIREKWNADVIYVRERVTSYNRKRLIEQKIPFIVPGNQMYLPMLGIDLREHFRKLRAETPRFSPATQALIIHVLRRRGSENRITPAEAAHTLGYTTMSMTRAFNELEAANLEKIAQDGRQHILTVSVPRQALWEKALPFLRSPVKKRIHARLPKNHLPGPVAGLTALARRTDIAEPDHPIVAVSREKWKALKTQQQIIELPVPEPDAVEIEVWGYTPELFAGGGIVDPFSLFLSLKGHQDERVEAALEEMMRGIQW
jgi:DNA-binding MarR family transcriptional regulator